MAFRYFTVEFTIEVHDNIIRESGGFMGIRDGGLLIVHLTTFKTTFITQNWKIK